MRIKTTLIVAACLAACSTPADTEEAEPSSESSESSGSADSGANPLAAIGAVGQAYAGMADAAKKLEELQKREPVEPVGFRELLALLPEEVDSFAVKGKPKAQKTKYGQFQISNASKRYADGKSTLSIEVTDAAFNAPLYSTILMAGAVSNESLEGYEKGVTVAGNPGFEKWREESKRGELTVLVGERFLVAIRVRGAEAGLMRTAFAALDTAGLAKLGE